MGKNQFENSGDFDLMSATTGKKRSFRRKKRGIAGFFQRMGDSIAAWWYGLKKWKKVTISILTALLVGVLIASIVILSVFDYNYKEITQKPQDLGFENVIDKKIVNIALFGIDTRDKKSFSGNSDSMMILSINTELKTVKIVSLMRDSLVPIQNGNRTSYRKLNSAYASGGPELAIKTINQNFGLDISEYATVNFFGMSEIIDAVGGIDIELTKQEVSATHIDGFNGLVKRLCKQMGVKNPEKYYINEAGKHHVNGIQAVAYSRIRKYVNIWGTNNDFGRTDRQRYVMEQLFNKALKLEKSKYVKLVKALIPYTETSLSYSEIMGLAFDVLLHSPTFEQTRMPMTEYQMRSPNIPSVGSVVYYDLNFAKNLLHAFFYQNVSPEDYVAQNGIGKNDWYGQITGNYGGSGQSSNTTSNTSSTQQPQTPSTNVTSSEPIVSGDQTTSDVSSDMGSLDTSSDMTSSTDSVPSDVSSEQQTPSVPSVSTPTTTPETPPTTSEVTPSEDNTTTTTP